MNAEVNDQDAPHRDRTLLIGLTVVVASPVAVLGHELSECGVTASGLRMLRT